MPRKAVVFLTTVFNSILGTTKFPLQWKYSHILMILKPNKDSRNPSSYRPISLLPVCSKIFEKLIYKRILEILTSKQILPEHQFGFRSLHSTIHQLHRVTDYISVALEKRLYAAGVFLDVAQAFDRVSHNGLLFKRKYFLPSTYYLILLPFLSDRFFSVQQGTGRSTAWLNSHTSAIHYIYT
ncbi:RNA-directed DNA polymerase [Sodalis sp.]|uniref:RNA-directed DNA polymerase n=1 Tax=Sodalis sp. (in: enterobacteria) TaxID=1898979 RepID=UPI0038736BD4